VGGRLSTGRTDHHVATVANGREALDLINSGRVRPCAVILDLVMPTMDGLAFLDDLQRTLQAEGIQTGLHYPIPVHLQPAHADLRHQAGDFPQSEAAAREVLSLPIFPEMTLAQVEEVAAAVRQEANVAHV